MPAKVDVLILGTGQFAARILFDLAATSDKPLTIAVAGRNGERLDWLRTAGNARADIFGRPVRVLSRRIDLLDDEAAAGLLAQDRPAVVVQAASLQPAAVISTTGDAWSRLVAEGGLSATAVFQARLSLRVATVMRQAQAEAQLINCCFPDVVNPLIAAAGLPIACGIGNIAILAHAFAGLRRGLGPGALRLLAHYQTVAPWRRPAAERQGPVPRVWIAGREVADVLATFAAVRLTPEPVIDISGASGAPLIRAMALGGEWRGHVPGPLGLPGGYPARYRGGRLRLDLPAGMMPAEAVAWNAGFEAANGLLVEGGQARYTGVLYERLRAVSPALSEGFAVRDIEAVYDEMAALRARLRAQA